MVDENNTNEEIEVENDEFYTEKNEDELEDIEATAQDSLKALRKKLKECEAEKQSYLDDVQRARADFLNSRRRLEEQLERDRERATDKILIELLTVSDSFDIAMADTERWNALDANWKNGIEAIYAKLSSILKSNNITPIDPVGSTFNPEEHEAVSNNVVEDKKLIDTVTGVLQKGYKRNDHIIRPARVMVGTSE